MNGFRKEFLFPSLSVANWFPGHMAKGMRAMARKMQYCDCVLEVHDAREGQALPELNLNSQRFHLKSPFSGRNPNLNAMLKKQPKILLLNKMDLADSSMKKAALQVLKSQGEKEVIFTDCRTQHHDSIKQLMSRIRTVVDKKDSHDEEGPIRLMVMGMPNVGKSSLINAMRRNYLRKGKGTKVGKIPGVTRSVLAKIIVAENPRIYLIDTPGVMLPRIPSEEVAMKLAVIGMLRDHLIGERLIADYLLFVLNQHKLFEYVNFYKLPEPCDDIEPVLDQMAHRIGALCKGGTYDHTRAAQHFLVMFRAGKLGQITLDSCPDLTENAIVSDS